MTCSKCNRPRLSPPTIVRPAAVNAQYRMSPSPRKVAISSALSMSQSRTVPSAAFETARHPSGLLSATALISSVWPFSVRSVWPLFRSQRRNVWSADPETARRPSELSATAQTLSAWPFSVRSLWRLFRFHTRRVLSEEPETKWRPSGASARKSPSLDFCV
jgi:hypothetical protein